MTPVPEVTPAQGLTSIPNSQYFPHKPKKIGPYFWPCLETLSENEGSKKVGGWMPGYETRDGVMDEVSEAGAS